MPARAALVACAALAACAPGPEEDEPMAAADPTAGWSAHAIGAVSFRSPPDVVPVPVQGIDSLVGQLEGPGVSIEFDYGWYSDDSFGGHLGDPALRIEEVTVGGRRARLGAWVDTGRADAHPHAMAAYFPDVLGAGEGAPGETKLFFVVRFADPAFADEARRILMSIRIDG
jgi:hypothetical protein